jgi:pyruvate-formate lyase
VGGYLPTDDAVPTCGANPVTMLCLKAARRIPVSAPTLSLRVHKDMAPEYLDEAARCILAGGAHPILYNDDKLCPALEGSGTTVGTAWSRNYAADGCYEPMFAGASEFTFFDVTPMSALEQALNQARPVRSTCAARSRRSARRTRPRSTASTCCRSCS